MELILEKAQQIIGYVPALYSIIGAIVLYLIQKFWEFSML